jgi:serine/threonine protein kinase
LYELFTGRTPFYASTIQQLTPKIIHDYVRFPANMPIALRELIDGMLQKTEAKRYDWDQVKNHPFFAETEQESCKEK